MRIIKIYINFILNYINLKDNHDVIILKYVVRKKAQALRRKIEMSKSWIKNNEKI